MERFILRTEIKTSRESVVSYGYDLTPTSVFMVTDWHAPQGTLVTVRLSFPRALGPVDVAARVAEHRVAGAPGEPAGLVLAFDPDVPRTALDALLAEVAALHDAQQGRPGYRVLLVEDNSLTRDVFTYSAGRYFGAPGNVIVDHAESAEAAWQLLGSASYDVVIVDYFLPTADGASLIAGLRADERLRGTPIVAISVGGRAAREATMSAGADLFVDKPLVFRDLFNTLQILAHSPARGVPETKRTILVLDDSPLALAVTRAALESAGFTVVVAEDLTTFERERSRCQPDLILVDVQMPEAYGDDIVATLLGSQAVAVPVVLFSSIDEPELARRSQEASATGYICKGAGMTELVRRCKELLGNAA